MTSVNPNLEAVRNYFNSLPTFTIETGYLTISSPVSESNLRLPAISAEELDFVFISGYFYSRSAFKHCATVLRQTGQLPEICRFLAIPKTTLKCKELTVQASPVQIKSEDIWQLKALKLQNSLCLWDKPLSASVQQIIRELHPIPGCHIGAFADNKANVFWFIKLDAWPQPVVLPSAVLLQYSLYLIGIGEALYEELAVITADVCRTFNIPHEVLENL